MRKCGFRDCVGDTVGRVMFLSHSSEGTGFLGSCDASLWFGCLRCIVSVGVILKVTRGCVIAFGACLRV